ncbi:MAG: DUF2069 domain-containing protein [Pseudomonadota bacterium]
MNTSRQNIFYFGSVGSLLGLICLCLAWELVLAPLRPGGSWMALKALPLLFPLRGILKRDIYTLQWSSMFILLYFTEGIVRGASDVNPLSASLAWTEVALSCLYFWCALSYLRPFKQAAKVAKKQAQDALKRS